MSRVIHNQTSLVLLTEANKNPISIKSGSSDLRIKLESLLGEHAELAVIFMQKGIDGAADFNDTAAALIANGDDLSKAVGSVYGAEPMYRFGANVTWDQAAQTAWVKAGNDTLTFWAGKNVMEVNEMKKEIGANVVLKDGRTQVPLRFITELLGWDVKWNDADWSITLTKAVAMGTHSH